MRTASNSSRVTKSRSANQRSIHDFIAFSASSRAPCATPIAFVINWDKSSNILFRGVIALSTFVSCYIWYELRRTARLTSHSCWMKSYLERYKRDRISKYFARDFFNKRLWYRSCAALVCDGLYLGPDPCVAYCLFRGVTPLDLAAQSSAA